MPKAVATNPSLDMTLDTYIEASIEAKGIGRRIRRLRLKQSMGLVELGQQAGLSASYLSQLETGRVTPTLKNLARVALVFKKDLSDFFAADDEHVFRISQAKNRVRLPLGEKSDPSLISESMSLLIPDRRIVPCLAEFLPGNADAAFHPHLFAGIELVYVIHGLLSLATGKRKEILHAADCAWVDGNVKRQYQAHDDQPAKALIVTFPLA